MSRIGKRPIDIPDEVTATISDGRITISGDNGELSREIPEVISVSIADDQIDVAPERNSRQAKAMWGTTASHIKNMLTGVTDGFEKKLTYKGIGYRANASGGTLNLEMGYSHEVNLEIPDTVSVDTENEEITVSGPDKETVGQFAASIRSVREPEPYKGSGIQYAEETIRRKEGKTAV